MAKNDSRNTAPSLNVFVLFSMAVLLLSAGWLMKSFPLLIFGGLAPLFAITGKAGDDEKFWNSAELILLTLSVSFFAGHFFNFSFLIPTLVQAIALSLCFVGYAFARQSVGSRLGMLTLLLFWLGFEYLFLKINQPERVLFLADAVRLQPGWLKWTRHTGYLGASAWILASNFCLYRALFKSGFQTTWMILFLIVMTGPILLSYLTADIPVGRDEMVRLYQTNEKITESGYFTRGEFISRTAAWISALIFTFALVKHKVKHK